MSTHYMDPTSREHKAGDKVWMIWGSNLIHCTIREVDDYFRKKGLAENPESKFLAHLFYDIDEPIGHSQGSEELYVTLEEALQAHNDHWPAEDQDEYEEPDDDLQEQRRDSVLFILSTHLPGKDYGKKELVTQEMIADLLSDYPTKERGKDWYTWTDIVRLQEAALVKCVRCKEIIADCKCTGAR